jgi:beta propeller repeat protein
MLLVAAAMGAVAVTEDTVDQGYADTGGDAVVWADNRTGDFEIYLFRMADNGTTRVTDDPGDQINPAVDGERIVWQDDREGTWDIYCYDLAGGGMRPLANGSGDQQNPAVCGDVVAWQDNRSGKWEIMIASLQTGGEVQASEGEGNHLEPSLTPDLVVWNVEANGTLNIRAASLQPLLAGGGPPDEGNVTSTSAPNAENATSTSASNSTAGGGDLRASFSMNRTFGKAPVNIQFFDTSSGEIDEYAWDFGDGEASEEQDPAHRFNESGEFPVTLTVANAGGSDSASHTVTVS